jgi:hypothetical protein
MMGIEKYFIICKCGKIIPFVYDSRVLGRAIEEHVEEHKRMIGKTQNADSEVNSVHEYLLQQVFEKAAALPNI